MFKIAELLIVLVCCATLLINGQFVNTGRPEVFDHPTPVVPGDCGPAKEVACYTPILCKTDNTPGANQAFICKQTCLYCYTCAAEGNIKPVIKELCQKKTQTCCSAETNPLVHFNNRNVDCGQHPPCKRTFDNLARTTESASKINKKEKSTAKHGTKKNLKAKKPKGSNKKHKTKQHHGGKKPSKKQKQKMKKAKGQKKPKKK